MARHPQCGGDFFILDAVEAAASREEMDSLEKLRKMTPFLFFVQTKIDLVGNDERKQWQDRNLQIIADTLQLPREKLLYFPVSARLKEIADASHSPKDLNESGYVPLLYFLHEKLLKTKEGTLARVLLRALAIEAAGMRRRLGGEYEVFSTGTKEGLDALEREYSVTKTQFEKWRATECQHILTEFQNSSSDSKRDTLDRLQNQLDPPPLVRLSGRSSPS